MRENQDKAGPQRAFRGVVGRRYVAIGEEGKELRATVSSCCCNSAPAGVATGMIGKRSRRRSVLSRYWAGVLSFKPTIVAHRAAAPRLPPQPADLKGRSFAVSAKHVRRWCSQRRITLAKFTPHKWRPGCTQTALVPAAGPFLALISLRQLA